MTELQQLREKALSGDAEACFQYAERAKAYKEKVEFYSRSIHGNCTKSVLPLVSILSKNSYSHLNDDGISECLNEYACKCFMSKTKEIDEVALFEILKIASVYNCDAKLSLAYCLFNGIGTKKNNKKAYDILLSTKTYGEFVAFQSQKTKGISYVPPKSKRASKKRKKDTLKTWLRWPLNLIFHPYISIWKSVLDSSLNSQIPEGERTVGDAAGEGCGLILLDILYFAFLNVSIYFGLKWIFNISGIGVFLLIFVILLALSIIYVKLSDAEFKEIDQQYKQQKKRRKM